jgi:hypothetical protein
MRVWGLRTVELLGGVENAITSIPQRFSTRSTRDRHMRTPGIPNWKRRHPMTVGMRRGGRLALVHQPTMWPPVSKWRRLLEGRCSL